MGEPDFRRGLRLLALSALAYLLADLPIQLTGFLRFGSWIGVKSFLPVTLGLFFGPWGVLGGMLGCIATAGMLQTPLAEAAFECICIALTGVSSFSSDHTRFSNFSSSSMDSVSQKSFHVFINSSA